jgi:hypothetical protein
MLYFNNSSRIPTQVNRNCKQLHDKLCDFPPPYNQHTFCMNTTTMTWNNFVKIRSFCSETVGLKYRYVSIGMKRKPIFSFSWKAKSENGHIFAKFRFAKIFSIAIRDNCRYFLTFYKFFHGIFAKIRKQKCSFQPWVSIIGWLHQPFYICKTVCCAGK